MQVSWMSVSFPNALQEQHILILMYNNLNVQLQNQGNF